MGGSELEGEAWGGAGRCASAEHCGIGVPRSQGGWSARIEDEDEMGGTRTWLRILDRFWSLRFFRA